VRVTLIDRQNYHVFQPLLYQVATAALSPGPIAIPIRSVLRKQRNTRVVLGEVTCIDLARRCVVLAEGEIPYDFLILASGARHAYFGHDGWEPLAPGLKSLEDALELRRRILRAYEEADRDLERAGWRLLPDGDPRGPVVDRPPILVPWRGRWHTAGTRTWRVSMPPEPYAAAVNAPDFPPGLEWLNTDHPLSLAELRGKIVILDFWTFG